MQLFFAEAANSGTLVVIEGAELLLHAAAVGGGAGAGAAAGAGGGGALSGGTSGRAGDSLSLLLHHLSRFPGTALLVATMPCLPLREGQLPALLAQRLHATILMPAPTAKERKQLWRRLLPHRAPVAKSCDYDAVTARLASRYKDMVGATIKAVLFQAAAKAASRMRDHMTAKEGGGTKQRVIGPEHEHKHEGENKDGHDHAITAHDLEEACDEEETMRKAMGQVSSESSVMYN
jgi:hypothetical protein